MKRYATIATVWLLPPLLLAAIMVPAVWNYGIRRIEYQPAYGFAIFAALFSLAGAVVAARTKPGRAGPTLRRLRLASLTLVLGAPVAALFVVYLRSILPFSTIVWAIAAMTIWASSAPLWGAFLFYRPDTRGVSLRSIATVITCILPFWAATWPCFLGCIYYERPGISSPTGGASF